MKTRINQEGTLMNTSKTVRLIALLAFGAVLSVTQMAHATVVGSKHDLSTTGGDPGSTQPCAFCHTPHGANASVSAPLWNRFVDLGMTYQMYSSSTMNSTPSAGGVAGGISAVCLGCHDGVVSTAVVAGNMGSDKHDLVNAPGPGGVPDTTSMPNCNRCHPDIYSGGAPVSWMGTDLRNDHPIRIDYPTPAQDPGFQPVATVKLSTGVRLYGASNSIECATCHDPHGTTNTSFLRMDNTASALCLTCHIK